MREKLMPWLPAIFLSRTLVTVIADLIYDWNIEYWTDNLLDVFLSCRCDTQGSSR